MKASLFAIGIVVFSLIPSIFSQGQVNFATKLGTGVNAVNAKFICDGGTGLTTPPFVAGLEIQGNSGAFTLIPGSVTSFRSGIAAGYVVPKTVTIPGHDIGTTVTLRAIGFAGASEVDYTGALATGHIEFSGPVTVILGDQVTPADLAGLQGTFSADLRCVPEPSTIALALFSAAALVFRHRK
jgi:hypothetical protein